MMNLILDKRQSLLSFEAYDATDGFKALKSALQMTPDSIIERVTASNLIGRGGAGFPTGLKMSYVSKMPGPEKYIICNADEGEPGTFKDRELLRRNPMKIFESMIIAAYAVGASKGYLYVRGEYSYLKEQLMDALKRVKENGYLGTNILNRNFNFDLEIRTGIGAYVCGEETALIESIEGRTGDPRIKPPYTANKGLFGKPTLVNNVETFVNLIPIIRLGPDVYKSYGTKESSGTKLFSLSGCVDKRGVYEVPFGITIRALIENHCGGTKDNKLIKFVQIGGSSGPVLPESMLDTPLSYEAFKALGYGLGSGAIIVVDESICVLDYLKATAAFFEHESCGKCTPCREGNRHIYNILNRLSSGRGKDEDLDALRAICYTMQEASFCGLGQTAPTAILSMLEYFSDEILAHVGGACFCKVCKFQNGGD